MKIEKELAVELLRAIVAMPDETLEEDAETVFMEMATEIISNLEEKGLSLVHSESAAAATRIMECFTSWCRAGIGRGFRVELNGDRFRLRMYDRNEINEFSGETIQDAYAQAAQVICLEQDTEETIN